MLNRLPFAFLALLLAPIAIGCESEEEPVPPATCAEANVVGGVCAGAPSEAICDGAYCTQGVQCAAVHEVSSDSQLTAVSGTAAPGDCIALGPGTYGTVTLSQGVSLLGKGKDHVFVGGVSTNGAGVNVRGITISGGSLDVMDGDTRISASVITGSTNDGIVVNANASVTVERSEVTNASRYGISAFNAGNVNVLGSIITGSGTASGPGMWAQCNGGCICETTVEVNIADSKFLDTSVVGIAIVGAKATISNVEVRGTTTGQNFQHGGGVSISSCSDVDATDLLVMENADFGILVDDSSIDFNGLDVGNNLRGMWIQNIGMSMQASAVIRNAEVTTNEGVGIGVAQGSAGVTIEDSNILDTEMIVLPVLIGGVSAGSESVGDGVTWKGGSDAILRGVTIGNSARASILIDGPVGSGSIIDTVTLLNGDEGKGIIQQNLAIDGTKPVTSGTSPQVATQTDEAYAVPDDIIPPSIAPQP
jgi:hypothetical protein